MKKVFVDTAYWLALLVKGDQYHAHAVAWSEIVTPPLVTTQAVLFEVADALTIPPVREMAAQFLDSATSDPQLTIVTADRTLLGEAIELFCERPDKDWGLTDCLSFVVMQQYGLTASLTCDQHFVQAGFRALLLEKPR